MDCPCCKEPMVVLELAQVEIDNCLSCGGIWLDEGELELLMESAERKDEVLSSFSESSGEGEEKRRCPICLKKMKKISVEKEGVLIIDKCRKDHGIWLDKGELCRIIETGTLDRENRVLGLMKDIFGGK